MLPTSNHISVVIPTYERGQILLATIEMLLAQTQRARAIIVVDQTQYSANDLIAAKLSELNRENSIEWVQLSQPSIPKAMNVGLMRAETEWVLFLDDDIKIDDSFLAQHVAALSDYSGPAHVGCILQPGEQQVSRAPNYDAKAGLLADLQFPFNSNSPARIQNCMAGNLMVKRLDALGCGAFDENFIGAAYRFETEFCRRLIEHTKQPFYFYPAAQINHLKAARGGTRQFANFLTSVSPAHSVGEYYFAILRGRPLAALHYCTKCLMRAVVARFYLRHPWYIPVRLIAELRGLFLAVWLRLKGPRLVSLNQPR